jgi:hypothetical protein
MSAPSWAEAVCAARVQLEPAFGDPSILAWTASATFRRWLGGDPASLPRALTYGKASNVVADSDDAVSFAEVEIVKGLRAAGWSAGWLDTFGRAPLRSCRES